MHTLKLLIEASILPPGIFILALAFCTWQLKPWRKSLATITLLFWLMSTPFIGNKLLASLQYRDVPTEENISLFKADAVLVLISDIYPTPNEYSAPQISASSLPRVRYAVHLSKTHQLPLVVSGGWFDGNQINSAQLAETLISKELSLEVSYLDTVSRNTAEHGTVLEQPLITDRKWSNLLLVTDSWHMRRALESFQNTGFEVLPAPTGLAKADIKPTALSSWLPSMWALQRSFQFLNEKLHKLYKVF